MNDMDMQEATLGTLLRSLIDLLDPAVQRAYQKHGIDYRPRYTPVIRALLKRGPSRAKEIAEACGVSQSAISQTLVSMTRDGWVLAEPGADGRERILRLSKKALEILPALQEQWADTNAAARKLREEVGEPIEDILKAIIKALQRQSFDDRIDEAGRLRAKR